MIKSNATGYFPYTPAVLMLYGLRESLDMRSEEHTSELQSQSNLVCRLLLETKKQTHIAWLANPAPRRVAMQGQRGPAHCPQREPPRCPFGETRCLRSLSPYGRQIATHAVRT